MLRHIDFSLKAPYLLFTESILRFNLILSMILRPAASPKADKGYSLLSGKACFTMFSKEVLPHLGILIKTYIFFILLPPQQHQYSAHYTCKSNWKRSKCHHFIPFFGKPFKGWMPLHIAAEFEALLASFVVSPHLYRAGFTDTVDK